MRDAQPVQEAEALEQLRRQGRERARLEVKCGAAAVDGALRAEAALGQGLRGVEVAVEVEERVAQQLGDDEEVLLVVEVIEQLQQRQVRLLRVGVRVRVRVRVRVTARVGLG